MNSIRNYLHDLIQQTGRGWNQFWFKPTDPAALCVLRIVTGLMALYVVGTYGIDLQRFFGPQGIVSAAALGAEQASGLWRYSYLAHANNASQLQVLHVGSLAILVLFTVGLWSRVTSVLAWLVVLSYLHRGVMFTSQVEMVLVLVMFYLCFAPTGAWLSVDQWLAKRAAKRNAAAWREPIAVSSCATISTRLIQVHLTAVYVAMVLGKLSYLDVWWDGTAVWWLAAKPETSLFDFAMLHGNARGLNFAVNLWTHAIVLFEALFAILIWNRWTRPLMLAVSVLMWGSLSLIAGYDAFCLMMVAAGMAFVSPRWLRQLGR